MSVASIFKAIMTRFSHGESVYIRTFIVAGGSDDLFPVTDEDYVDLPLDHVAKTRKLRADDVISPDKVSIGDIKVILFFGSTITQDTFEGADGIVIGGTYDSGVGKVSDGKYFSIRKETVVLLFTDSGPASGVEFEAAYKGDADAPV